MSTQIILTAPVDNLGAEGDTVTVADGYARNFLFPKGLAMPATAGNLRRIESLRFSSRFTTCTPWPRKMRAFAAA